MNSTKAIKITARFYMMLALFLTFFSSPAFAQTFVYRLDPAPVMTVSGNVPIGGFPTAYLVPSATIKLCTDSACNNRATAYTDATGSTPCALPSPVTLPGTSTCTSTSGSQGQFGFWVQPGTYYYTVTTSSGTFGPYPISSPTAGTLGGPGIVSSNSSGGLAPMSSNLDCSRSSGASESLKLNACALALPVAGGTLNALNMGATQTWNSDMFSGITAPVVLVLGKTAITCSVTQTVPAGSWIQGQGNGQTSLTRSVGGNCFKANGNNIHFSGLTINLSDPGSTVGGIGFGAATTGVTVEQNEFVGLTSPATTNTFAIVANNSFGITRLKVLNNTFTSITYPFLEDNGNLATNSDWLFEGNTLTNTGTGLSVNQPCGTGAIVSGTCPAPGGSTTGVRIINNYCNGTTISIGSWCAGASGIGIKTVTIANNNLRCATGQLIHVEDGATDITISGNTLTKCGAANAGYALVQVIGAVNTTKGTNHIQILGNTCDLTDVPTIAIATYCFGVYPGGGMYAPHHVDILGNTAKLTTGQLGVVAGNTYALRLSNSYENPDYTAKSTAMVSIVETMVDAFHEHFYNPSALYQIDPNSSGSVTQPYIDGDRVANVDVGLNTAPAFAMVRGTSGLAASTTIVFDGFSIIRTFQADAAATANTIFPEGYAFNGNLSVHFQFNGAVSSWTSGIDIAFDGSNFSVANPQRNCGADNCGPALTRAGGSIKGASLRVAGTINSVANWKFMGSYTPAP